MHGGKIQFAMGILPHCISGGSGSETISAPAAKSKAISGGGSPGVVVGPIPDQYL